MDARLKHLLEPVAARFVARGRNWRYAGFWLVAGVVVTVLSAAHALGAMTAVSACVWGGVSLAVAGFALLRGGRQIDGGDLAQRIEKRFAGLDGELLVSVQRDAPWATEGDYLPRMIDEAAIGHGRAFDWNHIVSLGSLWLSRLGHAVAFLMLLAACGVGYYWNQPGKAPPVASLWPVEPPVGEEPMIEPGDVELERGSDRLIIARFPGRLPSEAELVFATADGETRLPMNHNLNDPVFAARLTDIDRDGSYYVIYGAERTRDYRITTYELPRLVQADATINYPDYTGADPAELPDARTVSAVEGSMVTWNLQLNKDVATAELIREDDEVIAVERNGGAYAVALPFDGDRSYRLRLVDEAGRANRSEDRFRVLAMENRTPEIKLTFPRSRHEVSPLEEMQVEATAWDDFGLVASGLSVTLPGGETTDVTLASTGDSGAELQHLFNLEEMSAAPDDLITYAVWADDHGPGGEIRRTYGDLNLAEVRRFEELFREGESQPGGQQQGQQGGQQGQQGGGQTGELLELQRQVITATWQVMQRGDADAERFTEDAATLMQSQQEILTQAGQAAQQATDAEASEYASEAVEAMETAVIELQNALSSQQAESLKPALAAEQLAYQSLLRLRSREHEVVRSQNNGGGGGGGGGAASGNRQLQQLQLQNEERRYETESQASQPQSPEEQQRRDVLDKLRQLAQRQEDLNDQINEAAAALAAADEEEREEIERRLKRLREQQQQLLQEVDELRPEVERSQAGAQSDEAARRLDQARNRAQQASEALEQGLLQEAAAAGARAAESLDKMQEQFRQDAASPFAPAAADLRSQARELVERQNEIREGLTGEGEEQSAGPARLRDEQTDDVARQIAQQLQAVDDLLERMQNLSEAAEIPEPLFSRRLYDGVRRAATRGVNQSLEQLQRLEQLGFRNESAAAESEASQGVRQLARDVEDAAAAVLGNENEALQRAQETLDELMNRLDEARGTANTEGEQPGGAAGSEQGAPSEADANAAGSGSPSTNETAPGDGGSQESQSSPNGEQTGEREQSTTGESDDGQDGRPSDDAENSQQESSDSSEFSGQGGSSQSSEEGQNDAEGQSQSSEGEGQSQDQSSNESNGQGRGQSESDADTASQGQGGGSGGQGQRSGESPSESNADSQQPGSQGGNNGDQPTSTQPEGDAQESGRGDPRQGFDLDTWRSGGTTGPAGGSRPIGEITRADARLVRRTTRRRIDAQRSRLPAPRRATARSRPQPATGKCARKACRRNGS